MKRWTGTRGGTLAAAIGLVLVCFTAAWAAPPEGKGGGGGGGGGGDKGPSYQIVQLDTDDGTGGTLSGNAFDINSSRLIVGSADLLAACWTVTEVDGELQSNLHHLDNSSFTYSLAFGCNDGGEIVGTADDSLAVYWADKNATAEGLPAPLAIGSAEAINNGGVSCGWSAEGFNVDLDEQKALAWSFTGGAWQYLELTTLGSPGEDQYGNPLADRAYAVAISDADPVTGVIMIAGQSNGNAVIWTVALDGNGSLLAGPAMILDPGDASGINNSGTVCGSTGGDGVVWAGGGPADVLALDESQLPWGLLTGLPMDINDNGVVVGDSGHAVMWPNKDASLVVLDDFLPRKKSPFSSLTAAHAVNGANEIVGVGSPDGSDSRQPFLAVPK
jgi:hypothetical protein